MLSAASDQSGKPHLIAAAASHSGTFRHARPCTSLEARLDNMSLRVAIVMRLESSVCFAQVCVCGASVNGTGRRGRSCRKSAGRLSRHISVNELVKRALM